LSQNVFGQGIELSLLLMLLLAQILRSDLSQRQITKILAVILLRFEEGFLVPVPFLSTPMLCLINDFYVITASIKVL
jgi:hypothetical protein